MLPTSPLRGHPVPLTWPPSRWDLKAPPAGPAVGTDLQAEPPPLLGACLPSPYAPTQALRPGPHLFWGACLPSPNPPKLPLSPVPSRKVLRDTTPGSPGMKAQLPGLSGGWREGPQCPWGHRPSSPRAAQPRLPRSKLRRGGRGWAPAGREGDADHPGLWLSSCETCPHHRLAWALEAARNRSTLCGREVPGGVSQAGHTEARVMAMMTQERRREGRTCPEDSAGPGDGGAEPGGALGQGGRMLAGPGRRSAGGQHQKRLPGSCQPDRSESLVFASC